MSYSDVFSDTACAYFGEMSYSGGFSDTTCVYFGETL